MGQEHVREEKNKSIVCNIIPPLRLKSPASTVQAVGFAMIRVMHEAMVADISRTVKVVMAPIGTVLTMKEL
jgi:hypothetical protein